MPVPKRRASQKSTWRPSSRSICTRLKRRSVSPGGTSSRLPVMRRCITRYTSSASSADQPLAAAVEPLDAAPVDRLRDLVRRRGLAPARVERSSMRSILRPSIAGASWRRIVSTSGSSGIWQRPELERSEQRREHLLDRRRRTHPRRRERLEHVLAGAEDVDAVGLDRAAEDLLACRAARSPASP